ncbi:MAG: hypothetical protein ACE5OZ_18765 [Candidatus Heimdallarchaeota archaeon]
MKAKRQIFLIGWAVALLLVFSGNSSTAIGFGDPEHDVFHTEAKEKGNFFPGIDILEVYTFGSTIVIQCQGPIPIHDDFPLTFLVKFTTDRISGDWDAAIQFSSQGHGNWTTAWIIGDPDESSPLDWEVDNTGSRFNVTENQLTLIFSEFTAVSTSEIAVITSVEIHDDDTGEHVVFKDWAPDYYQPHAFEFPPASEQPGDDSSTPPETSLPPSSSGPPSEPATTPQTIPADFFGFIIALAVVFGLRKRRNRT